MTPRRPRVDEARSSTEALYRLLIESVRDYAIFALSPSGDITLWSAGAEQLFGYRAADIVGSHHSRLYTPEDVSNGVPELALERATAEGYCNEDRWRVRSDGSRFVAADRIALFHDAAAGLQGFVHVAHDVTEHKLLEQTMWRQAFHDKLTGLPNRGLFIEHLQRIVAHAQRQHSRFAVLFLDVDQFKAINDTLGHGLADRLLSFIAERLEKCVRPEDVVARLGGDEFAILMNEVSDPADVIEVAERIRSVLAKPFQIEEHEIAASASVGIAFGSDAYMTPEHVLRDADTAMYEAKRQGRARYMVFDAGMHARAVAHRHMETDLRQALARQEFQVLYQPIISVKTSRTVGYEALVRWKHPTDGIVNPATFIRIAEETGLIIPIDRCVLLTACQQLRAWQQRQPDADPPLFISVNFASKQFARSDLSQYVSFVLDSTGVDPKSLKIELTESALMATSETSAASLWDLRALGIDLHVDDFGTGYSSLGYLRRLPVNMLKIDQSFVRDIDSRPGLQIARAITMLAHNLNLPAMAEGVELPGQLAALKELGCDFAQGHLFSKPMRTELVFEEIGRGFRA